MIFQKEIEYKKGTINLFNLRSFAIENYDCCGTSETIQFFNKFFNFANLDREYLFIVGYDDEDMMQSFLQISIGTDNETAYHNKSMAIYAILSHCHIFRLFHNHPNGILMSSNEDDKIGTIAITTLSLFEFSLKENIIVTDEGYYDSLSGTTCSY